MCKFFACLFVVFLGFAAYPLVFLPLAYKYLPDSLAKANVLYADYLKLWGL